MKVLEFLNSGGTIRDLEDKYAIKSKTHQKYPNLVLLKYSQLESPFAEEIVRECRGLIIDVGVLGKYTVVSRSFSKFFNYGEGHAASIDWNTATCYEKLDGSLAVLYWYDGKWHVQTSGTPDASGEVDGYGFTFEKLFWDTWNELGYKLPSDNWQQFNFIFELCTKHNKIVVQHKQSRIVFLGARTRDDFKEQSPYWFDINKEISSWEVVKSYPLTSFKEIITSCSQINPMEQEGYVVCDANFNRVKVKSPQYIALNNLRDGHGPKRILEIIRTNEMDEFLTYFPEWTEEYNKYLEKYENLNTILRHNWYEFKDIESQKEFALAIQNIPFNGALFMMRAGKVKSIREYLQNININSLVDYFK